MKTQSEIKAYTEKLEQHYLSSTEVMTDIDIHNANIRIERAVRLFRQGMDSKQIKETMQIMEIDDESHIEMSAFERARNEIQKHLIKGGIKKGSVEFKKREDKLLLEWAKGKH